MVSRYQPQHSKKIFWIIYSSDRCGCKRTKYWLLDIRRPDEGLKRAKSVLIWISLRMKSYLFIIKLSNHRFIAAQENNHRFCVIPSDGRSIDDIFDIIVTKINERRLQI